MTKPPPQIPSLACNHISLNVLGLSTLKFFMLTFCIFEKQLGLWGNTFITLFLQVIFSHWNVSILLNYLFTLFTHKPLCEPFFPLSFFFPYTHLLLWSLTACPASPLLFPLTLNSFWIEGNASVGSRQGLCYLWPILGLPVRMASIWDTWQDGLDFKIQQCGKIERGSTAEWERTGPMCVCFHFRRSCCL